MCYAYHVYNIFAFHLYTNDLNYAVLKCLDKKNNKNISISLCVNNAAVYKHEFTRSL